MTDDFTVKLETKDMQHDGSGGKPDLPYGAFAKIARRLRPKVSVQHVREVYHGRRESARVQRAIETYVRGLARENAA